jgi:hypothetical protein
MDRILRHPVVVILAMIVASAAIQVGLGTLAAHGESHRQPVDLPYWTVRPCPAEDSVNCRWNAAEQGNGKGHTFVVRRLPGKAHEVCVFYADKQYAKTHDRCHFD